MCSVLCYVSNMYDNLTSKSEYKSPYILRCWSVTVGAFTSAGAWRISAEISKKTGHATMGFPANHHGMASSKEIKEIQ